MNTIARIYPDGSGYQYTAYQIGTTKLGIAVEVDVHLGAPGVHAATVMQRARLDIFHHRLADLFRKCVFEPQTFRCSILRSHTNGAVHFHAGSPDVYVGCYYIDGQSMPKPDPVLLTALMVCEMTEVYGAVSACDWLSDFSHGEALSRFVGEIFCPGVLAAVGIQSVPAWLNAPGRPDWITRSNASETDAVPIGCGIAFLHYLHDVLGLDLHDIVAAHGDTLEAKYQALARKRGGYAAMMAEIDRRYPPGTPVPATIAFDNPFRPAG